MIDKALQPSHYLTNDKTLTIQAWIGGKPMKVQRGFARVGLTFLAAMGMMATNSAVAHSEAGNTTTIFQITPYVWASGFGGTLQPGAAAPAFRVNKSFGELLEDVDAAFFISGYMRHDRFVAIADLTHTSSSRDGNVPTGNPALPMVPAEGRLAQTSMTALGGFRLVEQDDMSLDLLAGGRAWWIRPKVAVPAMGLSANARKSFVDPVVAARLNVKMSPKWSFLFHGDLGGFGIASELTAQAIATANARVTENIWISGGYRHLMVDYKSGNVRVDATLGGPILGATIAF